MGQAEKREQVRFWQVPELKNLELLWARFFTHVFPPHSHEEFTMCIVRRGVLTVDYHHENHTVPAGEIIIINPAELHTGAPMDEHGLQYRVFYPKAEEIKRIASNLAGKPQDVPFFPSDEIHDDRLLGLMVALHRNLEDKHSTRLEREVLFQTAMEHLITRHADSPPTVMAVKNENDYVRTVRDYIEDHYADDISLQDLASVVNLDPSYFLRVFKKTVGLPPYAYLNQVRINRAKHMLATNTPIVDTALQTGFVDQSHLTKRFKSIFGLTPGQYQAAFKVS